MIISHRERKKQQMRKAIIVSAHKLFTQKGYHATTIVDIVRNANCAPRTFFQYFSSKEELLFIGIDKLWDNLVQLLSKRQTEDTTLQLVRKWMRQITKEVLMDNSILPNLAEETPQGHISIKARQQLYSMTKLKEILIPELAKDLKLQSHDVEPILIATTAAAMFDSLHTDDSIRHTDKLIFIDKAITLLEGSMRSVRSKD